MKEVEDFLDLIHRLLVGNDCSCKSNIEGEVHYRIDRGGQNDKRGDRLGANAMLRHVKCSHITINPILIASVNLELRLSGQIHDVVSARSAGNPSAVGFRTKF